MKEILDFEKACGIKADVFLKNRIPENVDLRDIFIWINLKQSSDIKKIMDVLSLDRTSFYASQKRFHDRYTTYEYYRNKANDIKKKLSLQLYLF